MTMDALLPLASALIGALAALAGHAVTHLFGLNKVKHEKAIDRAEKICEAVYSIRRSASLRAIEAAKGVSVVEYSDANDRLHWQIALYMPGIVEELNEFLSTIRKMDAACPELIRMSQGKGTSQDQLEKLLALAGNLSKQSHDDAADVVSAVRKKYRKALLLS